jgi:sec-independent protein translocase protein TatA
MFGIGAPELIIVLVILLLLFGGSKLPQLSRSIGQSLREIRGGLEGSTATDSANAEPKTDPESSSPAKSAKKSSPNPKS